MSPAGRPASAAATSERRNNVRSCYSPTADGYRATQPQRALNQGSRFRSRCFLFFVQIEDRMVGFRYGSHDEAVRRGPCRGDNVYGKPYRKYRHRCGERLRVGLVVVETEALRAAL